MLATGSLLFTSVFFGWPNLKHWFTSNPRVVRQTLWHQTRQLIPPKARLYIPESARQLLILLPLRLMGCNRNLWLEEIKSEEEREALLTFTDRFSSVRNNSRPLPQYRIMVRIVTHTKASPSISKLSQAQCTPDSLTRCSCGSSEFSFVALFLLGLGYHESPSSYRNERFDTPLPWRFQQNGSPSQITPCTPNTEQTITAPLGWLSVQGIGSIGYIPINVFVVLQQDDEPVITKRITQTH